MTEWVTFLKRMIPFASPTKTHTHIVHIIVNVYLTTIAILFHHLSLCLLLFSPRMNFRYWCDTFSKIVYQHNEKWFQIFL